MDAKRRFRLKEFFTTTLFFSALLLTACGGGGGGSTTTPPPSGTQAPSGLSYPTPQAFTVGQATTAISPTVTGTVTGYSVSPALPAGLTLGTSDGKISGTPTAVAAQAKYTVTASNSGGSTTADIVVTVNDVAPTMSYPSARVALATGLSITAIKPSAVGGGAVTAWSVSPDLPAGLSLSSTDGSISGTPTSTSAVASFTITATNSGGQSNFTLTLSVQSATLLDLGHADSIDVLRFDGTHVLSVDVTGHWVLWNYAAGIVIASGDTQCADIDPSPVSCRTTQLADMAGQTIVFQTPAGFEVRSSVDGHVISSIPFLGIVTWQIATDGSYVLWKTGPGGLQVSSAAGASLLSRPSGYLTANVFAAPGEIRVPITVGTQNMIETTPLATGISTNSGPFNGTFQTWFVDGNRFLTAAGNTVLTYSAAAVPQDSTTVAYVGALFGSGNWFANQDITGTTPATGMNVYKVGASTSPAATFPDDSLSHYAFTASGTLLFARPSGGSGVVVVDLSGTTPTEQTLAAPVYAGTAYAASSATQWLFGNRYGVLFDGATPVATPRYLGYGAAWSIAGSGTRFAIATASGRVLDYDAATDTLEVTISRFSSKLVLSDDATVLATLGDILLGGPSPQHMTAKVYSLPGGGPLSTWPTNSTDPTPTDISLSGSTVLGQAFADKSAMTNPVAGGAAIWSTASLCGSVVLSPDGTHIACPVSPSQPDGRAFALTNATRLFTNGTLVTAFNGAGQVWLDNDHLLVNNWQLMGIGPGVQYIGASIYNAAGTVLTSPPLPQTRNAQVVTPNSIYSANLNSILSTDTGAVTWMTGDTSRGVGAVAGSNVVFASGAQVLSLAR